MNWYNKQPVLCYVLVLLSLLMAWGGAHAQENNTVIKVAVNPVEPFVFLDGDRPRGFSIDLWDAIATEANLTYEFVEVANVAALLAAVESKQVDLGIGATSITAAREQAIDFSQPFFASGLQIMTTREPQLGLLGTLRSVFTPNLLGFIAVTLTTLLVVAHVAWLIERKSNPAFQGGYLHGIWSAFYWTVATASTVGYGDTVLRANFGRLLAVTWMLFSLFLVSYFTATVTTSLALSRLNQGINGPEGLRGTRVIARADTTSAAYLSGQGLAFTAVSSTPDGINALQSGAADAFVYDAPVLQYYATLPETQGLQLVPVVFQKGNYGIVLQQDSPLREQVNQALLQIGENGVYDQLKLRWFGQ